MKHIVTIGGGTGSYTVLSGIKKIPDITITALVSMADDGGSTGVLRDELGVLPPGDVRQCLVALSEHSDVMRELMSYRFSEGSLTGHSFGNIFLAALEKVTGDFAEGVEIASEIMKVQGTVIPITKSKAELLITLRNGDSVKGETAINEYDIELYGIKQYAYTHDVMINPRALQAIESADSIILGPGNYYCSLLPALIVNGCKEALQNTKAKLIFPVNLTNKHGHTLHFAVSDYVHDIERYIGRKVDIVLMNNEVPSDEQVEVYQLQEGDGVLVEDDIDKDIEVWEGRRIIREKLLSHAVIKKEKGNTLYAVRGFIRHDKDKLAKVLRRLV